MKIFLDSAHFLFQHRQKSGIFRARYLVLIYTLKEAHTQGSRIFVTGGSFFARQMEMSQKKLFGRRL